MYNQGIHARSGVACADCHMPYKRVGALKISDHHVRSPLLNINRACQTCHKWPEDELQARVETIQDRTFEMRNLAMDALLALIAGHRDARAGATARTPTIAVAQRLPARRPSSYARLRRGGELDGLPRRPGGSPHPGQLDQLFAPGAGRVARGASAGGAARRGGGFGAPPESRCHPERSEGDHIKHGPLHFVQGDNVGCRTHSSRSSSPSTVAPSGEEGMANPIGHAESSSLASVVGSTDSS